ncbi:MAG: HAMP domain-containing sensor histidine kinase [Limisphaerales bacterium]
MIHPPPTATTEPERPWLRSRHLPALVIGATLAIFALGILAVTLHLRLEIREDIARREGEILHSVAMMLQAEEDRTLLDEPSIQLNVLLKTSRLKGVVAARLFDAQGRFVSAFPAYVSDSSLAAGDLAGLQRLHTVARPRERAAHPALFASTAPGEPPLELYEIIVPLHAQNERKLLGIAQFILDGRGLATELRGIDRSLANQAASVFLIGGAVMVVALRWAFGRLQRAQAQLARRSRSLLEANRELALASKTSAVGALSAHLLHELKSQLFGIQALLAGRRTSEADKAEPAWRTAADSAKRMQSLIAQLLGVMRNEQGAANHYEVSLTELAEIVSTQVMPLARVCDVNFTAEVKSPGTVSSRAANLVGIILGHLAQNAIQATPRKKSVRLTLLGEPHGVRCEMRDEGRGFPEELRPLLFKPCLSTKEGGSGLGLALCKQLAGHLDAELELERSTPHGCVFSLTLPENLAGDSATESGVPQSTDTESFAKPS